MLQTLKRDWKAVLVQSVVGGVVILAMATALNLAAGGAQRELASRVDANAAAVVDKTGTIVCILQLGLDEPESPPRNLTNIEHCVNDPTWQPLDGSR